MQLTESPKTLDKGGKATIDDRKELNVGIDKEAWLIYASSLLMPKEENEYFNFLLEYKDVFV